MTPEEQREKLTVTIPVDSKVLCLTCVRNAEILVNWQTGQVAAHQLALFQACMVVPAERWACPDCNTRLREGQGWGKCPCCGERRPATRIRWEYHIDCDCLKTAEQLRNKAVAEQMRQRDADREARPAAERAEASQAKAEARVTADKCLASKPEQRCLIPETALPYGDVCKACRRFDKRPAPAQRSGSLDQPKVSTPLRDQDFHDRPGWKDKVTMTDHVADAFGDW